MKENQFNFDKNTLVVLVSKTSIIIRGIILFFATLSFLIPLVVFIFMVVNHADLKFGFVILLLILWLPAYYLLRIVLWNTYGKERLSFGRESVIYEADYRFFKDSKQELRGDVTVEIFKNRTSNNDECTLLFKSENDKIETVIALPFEKWLLVIDELNLILKSGTLILE